MSEELNKEEKKDEHICGERCSIFSRVTGYYRPIENWNIGKQEEFKERKRFVVPTKYENDKNCCGDN